MPRAQADLVERIEYVLGKWAAEPSAEQLQQHADEEARIDQLEMMAMYPYP